MTRYLDELGDISEAASKEYQIEKTLDVQLCRLAPGNLEVAGPQSARKGGATISNREGTDLPDT